MRLLRLFAATAAAAAALVAASTLSATPSVGATASYSVRTLHFLVTIGPSDAQRSCDVVGDLYAPTAATPSAPVPAILTTNGFGGSKDDQAGIGAAFAQRGYVVLSYSGLGFGGSGCKITLDDPDYDGRAASQLVSYLGGAPGIAYTDASHTAPAPVLDVVVHDSVDHSGAAVAHDPRVGMIGGSYGGEIQFAAAADDPRVDTIVPLITWNDLSYSLDPNNTAQTTGVSTSTPGALKLIWGLGFSAEGVLDGLENAQGDPSRLYGCPNFADFVSPALVTGRSTGYFDAPTIAALRHASVATYMSKIKIPVLLMQGEHDTLFNLNEAAATYQALRAQGTTVKMIWQSWGHSQSTPAPGELSLAEPDPTTQYETARIADWFDHYLKGTTVGTGPSFAYFRDWVRYTGIATPAYATSSRFPVGSATHVYLSGDNTLQSSTKQVKPGSQTFVTPAAGAPTSLDPLDVVGSYSGSLSDEEADLPGTAASWTGPALRTPLDVAGSPTLTLRVNAPTAAQTQASGPAGQLVLFVKVEDVDPGGTAHLINANIAPVRVPDVTAPIRITLPGFVHRFPAGDHLRLVVAGGSPNYRGGQVATPVTIAGGTGQVLTLPVVG
jgi:ABC-2 type transport system ATP-binding protein